MRTILLLLLSNVFMTFAWYGHLKFTEAALWKVILVSWGIAFFEYCLMVPASRLGYVNFYGSAAKNYSRGNNLGAVCALLCFLFKRGV